MIGSVRMTGMTPLNTAVQHDRDADRPAHAAVQSPKQSIPHLLDLAAELAKAAAPIDYVRVGQIRREIADGSYKVDTLVLARSMLQSGPAE